MDLNLSDSWVATVNDEMMASKWAGQARQWPASGPPGLSSTVVSHAGVLVDCLFWRDHTGKLRGVLYHYRADIPPYERGGNINLWVDSTVHRRGIGGRLLAGADRRIGIRFAQQTFTRGGLALVRAHLAAKHATAVL